MIHGRMICRPCMSSHQPPNGLEFTLSGASERVHVLAFTFFRSLFLSLRCVHVRLPVTLRSRCVRARARVSERCVQCFTRFFGVRGAHGHATHPARGAVGAFSQRIGVYGAHGGAAAGWREGDALAHFLPTRTQRRRASMSASKGSTTPYSQPATLSSAAAAASSQRPAQQRASSSRCSASTEASVRRASPSGPSITSAEHHPLTQRNGAYNASHTRRVVTQPTRRATPRRRPRQRLR